MREIIKLRAWDGLNKKFTYWTMNDLCTWDTKDEQPSALDYWTQFTGLLDKNGVEIYEGDIVSIDWESGDDDEKIWYGGEVKYDEQEARFYVDYEGFENEWSGLELEVEGNIYENPNLLNP